MKGRGEVIMFGEVVAIVSSVAGGMAREVVANSLSEWLLRCVVETKEMSSGHIWVRVKIENIENI